MDSREIYKDSKIENKEEVIDGWKIITMYSSARKKKAWIECISLGYTMIEMGLKELLKSKSGTEEKPINEKRINKCRYLMELAELALTEGFITQDIYLNIKQFNRVRRKVIHKLPSNKVKLSEIENTAKQIGNICFKIQSQWLTLTAIDVSGV